MLYLYSACGRIRKRLSLPNLLATVRINFTASSYPLEIQNTTTLIKLFRRVIHSPLRNVFRFCLDLLLLISLIDEIFLFRTCSLSSIHTIMVYVTSACFLSFCFFLAMFPFHISIPFILFSVCIIAVAQGKNDDDRHYHHHQRRILMIP